MLAREREGLVSVARFHDAITGADHDPDELPQIVVVLTDEDRLGSAALHRFGLSVARELFLGFAP